MALSGLTLSDLLDYTEWERGQWLDWMRQQKPGILEIAAGPGGDGRFQKVGELIRHIFSAEKRYVDRLSDRPITDTAAIPAGDFEALFAFGRQSRRDLKHYIETLPAEDGNIPIVLQLGNASVTATPNKIVTHVLMHEIRHWAQIATLFRQTGLKVAFHDFLFSPAMGGELRRAPQTG